MRTPIYAIGNSPIFFLGLEKLLCTSAYAWQGFFSVSEKGLPQNEKKHPFLLILHLATRPFNLKYVQKLHLQYPQAMLVLLCDNEDPNQVKAYFQAGIRAYVSPTISPDALCQALQLVTKGQSFIDPQLSQQWIRDKLGLNNTKLALTRREKEVLHLIMEEFTTKEIAEKLFISPCTAETHRINIIQKMGVRNTAGVVREAIRMGL